MSQGILIRRAEHSDGARLVELDRELAQFEKLTGPNDVEAARLLSRIFESKKLEALVAEIAGRIEGVALFYEGFATFRAKPFLYLEDLVVSQATRGRRVGEMLMAALAREAVARETLGIAWAVLDWNERAMRFYERLGARRTHDWIRYTLEGEELKRVAGAGSPD